MFFVNRSGSSDCTSRIVQICRTSNAVNLLHWSCKQRAAIAIATSRKARTQVLHIALGRCQAHKGLLGDWRSQLRDKTCNICDSCASLVLISTMETMEQAGWFLLRATFVSILRISSHTDNAMNLWLCSSDSSASVAVLLILIVWLFYIYYIFIWFFKSLWCLSLRFGTSSWSFGAKSSR